MLNNIYWSIKTVSWAKKNLTWNIGCELLSTAGLTTSKNKKAQINGCHPVMMCIKAEKNVLSSIMWMK